MTKLPERLQNAITETRQRYGNAANFLATLNPSLQVAVAANAERAFLGHSPTITAIKAAYSNNVAEVWIQAHIEALNAFCGVAKKMTTQQMEELAKMIIVDFHYLKASELMLFFYRFKSGRYGELYGVVDPQRILAGLNKFIGERITEIAKYERERSRKEFEGYNNPDAISYEEYLKLKKEQDDKVI